MSTQADKPQIYEVNVSDRVFDKVLEFAATAQNRGDGEAFRAALREFYRRLHIYPQFGDPLIDLKQEVGQIRVGIIPPLAMRYTVLEEKRQVFVAALPVLLPPAVNS